MVEEKIENNSSSDEMVDIQIEESLVRESLMSIDSANFKDDLYTLIGFFCILVLTILIGVFGPPVSVEKEHTTQNGMFHLSYDSISNMCRYISFQFQFYCKNLHKISIQLLLKYDIKFFKNDKQVHFISQQQNHVTLINNDPTVPEPDFQSQKVKFFEDRLIDYDRIDLNIMFKYDNITDSIPTPNITLFSSFGHPDHTLFQIYFRIVFAIFGIIFLFLLVRRLRSLPAKLWHLEQKLTVPFLALSILYCNPFYPIYAFSPSHAYIILDTIITSLFSSYFKYFILVLFDSLRYKNRKTGALFFIPKIIFILITFLISVINGIYKDINSFSGNMIAVDNDDVLSVLKWIEIFLYMLYLVWVGFSIVLAGFEIDITEKYKFYMYLASCGTAIVLLAVVNIGMLSFEVFKNSSTSFVVGFTVQNVFVLLMAYFHWPYEVLHDQNYIDNTEVQPSTIETNDFFVNADNN